MDDIDLVERLLASDEPSIRWKVRVQVLGEDRASPKIQALERTIRRSPRVRTLLAGPMGSFRDGLRDPYSKWQGAHWVLASLADIGYPRGSRALLRLRDRLLDRWLGDVYYREFDATTKSGAYRKQGVPRVRGRYRRCASQQGNALYFLEKLGIANERSDDLAERLLHWQWLDGGWNCDRNPEADNSSFWESRRTPMVQGVRQTGDPDRLGRLGRGEPDRMQRMGDCRRPRGAQSRRPHLGRLRGPGDGGYERVGSAPLRLDQRASSASTHDSSRSVAKAVSRGKTRPNRSVPASSLAMVSSARTSE